MPKIDMDFLVTALEGTGEMASFFLDTQTGEVRISSDYSGDEEFEQEFENEPDRFIYIEPLSSHEAFEMMAEFVAQLPDGEERRLLEHALAWRGPFSNFRSALYEMPAVRERWYQYHQARMLEVAQEWLDDRGIANEED